MINQNSRFLSWRKLSVITVLKSKNTQQQVGVMSQILRTRHLVLCCMLTSCHLCWGQLHNLFPIQKFSLTRPHTLNTPSITQRPFSIQQSLNKPRVLAKSRQCFRSNTTGWEVRFPHAFKVWQRWIKVILALYCIDNAPPPPKAHYNIWCLLTHRSLHPATLSGSFDHSCSHGGGSGDLWVEWRPVIQGKGRARHRHEGPFTCTLKM